MKISALVIPLFVAEYGFGQAIHNITPVGSAQAVTHINDINGDGSADFAIGTPGGIYFYSGLTGAVLSNLPFNGFALDAADINNDGKTDLVVGAPNAGSQNQGSVAVYDFVTATFFLNKLGPGSQSLQGRSVSVAGDTNADGFIDVITGGNNYATLYSGKDGSNLHDFGSLSSGDFGFSVGGGSDFNADGFTDVIVGDPLATPTAVLPNAGNAKVFRGNTFQVLMNLNGTQMFERLGDVVQLAPSLNSDALGEALVLSRTHSVSGGAGGAIQVLIGPFGAPPLWIRPAMSPGGGRPVDVTPDKNNDGKADILVAGVNVINLLSGANGATITPFSLPAIVPSVSDSGDVNCDDVTDAIAATGSVAIVYSHVCGEVESYGIGCKGSGGLTPLLTVTGCPIALGKLTVSVTNGIGPSAAAILIGTTRANIPISSMCSLLVGNILPGAVSFPLEGTGLNGSGHATFDATLPCAAAGLTLDLQAFVYDITTPLGFSASQGVEVRVY